MARLQIPGDLTIKDADGNVMTERRVLRISGSGVVMADNSGTDATDVTITPAGGGISDGSGDNPYFANEHYYNGAASVSITANGQDIPLTSSETVRGPDFESVYTNTTLGDYFFAEAGLYTVVPTFYRQLFSTSEVVSLSLVANKAAANAAWGQVIQAPLVTAKYAGTTPYSLSQLALTDWFEVDDGFSIGVLAPSPLVTPQTLYYPALQIHRLI